MFIYKQDQMLSCIDKLNKGIPHAVRQTVLLRHSLGHTGFTSATFINYVVTPSCSVDY